MRIDDINRLGPAVRAELDRQIKAEELRRKGKPRTIPKSDFDSNLEADFYHAEVLPKIQTGQIVGCELHKTFLLLPPEEYCGIKLHKAEYTPDFVLTYANGVVEVVETKSKAVRKLQQSYVYRRRLFIDKWARPNGWAFREIVT